MQDAGSAWKQIHKVDFEERSVSAKALRRCCVTSAPKRLET